VIEDGVYFIYANHAGASSYLVLDVPGGRGDDYVPIQQFGWHGGPNQQWRVENVGGNFFTIVNIYTGKAMDVPGGLQTPGLVIQQYSLHGGPNQQWRFETFPAAEGPILFRPEYHRIYNRASGLALDVPDGSQAWRRNIQQYTPHNGWNQTWLLDKV
jgi:hypothetical protein